MTTKITKTDTMPPLQPGEGMVVYRPESGYQCGFEPDQQGLIEEGIVALILCAERLAEDESFRSEMLAWGQTRGLRVPEDGKD